MLSSTHPLISILARVAEGSHAAARLPRRVHLGVRELVEVLKGAAARWAISQKPKRLAALTELLGKLSISAPVIDTAIRVLAASSSARAALKRL